jgi:HD-GYP domain-containing protein (c-di-GMP phosphodiesterase class II)
LIDRLLTSGVLLRQEWDDLAINVRDDLWSCGDEEKILSWLVDVGLLTHYQAMRVSAGKLFGLVLGNYRVLDRLGAGGMGVVYKGEHAELRRLVAIKVVPVTADRDHKVLSRLFAEMQILGCLHHPNIVTAFDSGRTAGGENDPGLRYLVMEYVPGQDLESYVKAHGPLNADSACRIIHQVARALVETNKCRLVHRDIKPSNVMVTPQQQAKLLDFGLARRFDHRITEPGTALGTIDFMAPEQSDDASRVDIRCDLYGLGGTLFWCLTGELPFPPIGNALENFARRATQPAPSVRAHRPLIAAELDTIVSRLLAANPDERYSSPEALMEDLRDFADDPPAERQPPTLDLRPSDVTLAPYAVVLTMAKLVGHRDGETRNHLLRMQRYCRVLAEAAAASPLFHSQMARPFIEMLERCAPLHDIGKVGLPDRVLLNPGELAPDERAIMEAHTVIGADSLAEVARQHDFGPAFLQMAVDVIRHHHERYDGHGFPDGLAGNDIPLAARIVAIADAYDSLRARRLSKPALPHAAAMELMLKDSPGQFDPALMPYFECCAGEVDQIYCDLSD